MEGKSSSRKSKFLVNAGEKLKELSSKPNFIYQLGISILVLLLFLPFFIFVINIFRQSGQFSLDGFRNAFGSSTSWHLISQTLILAFGSLFVALLAGLSLGFFFNATQFPLRRLFLAALLFPLCLPSYLWVLGWELILGRQGYLQELLWENAGDFTAPFLFSDLGAIFIFGIYYSGVIVISVMLFLALKRYSFIPDSNQSWMKNFFGFVFSYLKSSLFCFSAFLIVLMGYRDFGGSSLLGRETLSTEIFSFFSTFYNYDSIVAPGIVILVFSLIFWMIWELGIKKHLLGFVGSERRRELVFLNTGKWQTALFWMFMFLVTAFYFFPIWVFFLKSGGMEFYWEALKGGWGSILRTMVFSVLGSLVLVSFVLAIDRFIGVTNKTYASCVEKIFAFIFFIPGILTGVLLNRFWNHSWSAWIYTSYAIVFLGIVTQYVYPFWFGKKLFGENPNVQVHSPKHSEAQTNFFRKILSPFNDVRNFALVMGGLILFLREMGSSVLLYPPGQEPLLIKIFTLKPIETEPVIAGMAVIYLVLISIPITILVLRFRKI